MKFCECGAALEGLPRQRKLCDDCRKARKLAYIRGWQARNRSAQRGYQRAYYRRHKWGL